MTYDEGGFTDTWQFNVPMALATGAFTSLVRPADLDPRWLVRMHLGMGALGAIAGAGFDLVVDEEEPGEDMAGPRTPASRVVGGVVLGGLLGAVSVAGVWADGAIERSLVRRGVRRPRLWMGVAGAGLSLAFWAAERAMTDAPQHERDVARGEPFSSGDGD